MTTNNTGSFVNVRRNCTVVSILVHLFVITGGYANDGAFIANSGILRPIREARISIQREWLQFGLALEQAAVNVRFHFYNPDDTIVSLDVGFIVDRASGDVGYEETDTPGVSGFLTQMNGLVLPYKLYIQGCDTCALEVPEVVIQRERLESDDPNNSASGSNFVFLTTMSFRPGVNVVTHSYNQLPNTSIAYDSEYQYIISTASLWSGAGIDTFECEVRVPMSIMCYIEGMHDADVTRIIGTAREYRDLVDHPYIHYSDSESESLRCPPMYLKNGTIAPRSSRRLFRVIDAVLRFETANFRPAPCTNVSFTLKNPLRDIEDHRSTLSLDGKEHISVPNVDLQEHNRARNNMVYALHGLTFVNSKIQRYFNGQEWYIPDPNVTHKSIVLTEQDKWFLRELKEEEERRANH